MGYFREVFDIDGGDHFNHGQVEPEQSFEERLDQLDQRQSKRIKLLIADAALYALGKSLEATGKYLAQHPDQDFRGASRPLALLGTGFRYTAKGLAVWDGANFVRDYGKYVATQYRQFSKESYDAYENMS